MRRRLPRVDRTTAFIAIAALLLGILYMTAATWVQAHFADTVPSTSSLSTSSTGLKVWRDYLDRLGLRPQLLTDFSALPASSTIVLAGPFEKPPTEDDSKRLGAWVRAGGRAVFVGLDDGGIADAIGSLSGDVAAETTSRVSPSFPGAYASGIARISAGAGRFSFDDPAWVTLYGDAKGPSVVVRALGKGQAVWLADPAPVSNDGMGLEDDAAFAVQLASAPGERIYFDEYHHGVTTQVTAWGLLGPGRRAALLILLAGALALVVALGRRRGPAIARPDLPAARGGAYIGQLAELYRIAGARSVALEQIEDGLARALTRRYGDRAGGLLRNARAREAVEASAELRARGTMTKAQFVAAAQALRAARKEVEGGNG
jgi:hypothetical protein